MSWAPISNSGGKTIMPSCLSEMPSSLSEQIMPLDSTPRILAGFRRVNWPLRGSINWAPTWAKAILSPTLRLGAPQTTVCSPVPRFTVARWRRSALGWGLTAVICPMTIFSQLPPTTCIPPTSLPAMVSRSAISAGGRVMSTYSLSHFSGTFIFIILELS
ncbi:hypothetical protein ES703_05682 [subsurface metagenome]